MTPDICIYHANCDDGFAAAYAVWKKFGDAVNFVPCDYGQQPPDVSGMDVLMVDVSFNRDVMLGMAETAKRIIVLDHHKTAEAEMHDFTRVDHQNGFFSKQAADEITSGIGVCFDMDKSGCRLAWEYCFGLENMPDWFAALEDRDLWKFSLPFTEEIYNAVRSYPRDFAVWDNFEAEELKAEGISISRYVKVIVGNICDSSFFQEIAGYRVPIAPCSYGFVSQAAHELLNRHPDAPFAAGLVVKENVISYSLRSMDDRLDVSEVAKLFGGGGHRNAARFQIERPNSPLTSDTSVDYENLAKWALSENVGASSIFMAQFLTGLQLDEWCSHPGDNGDFKRCLDLLKAIPRFRDQLHKMADASPQWSAIVERWEDIENEPEETRHALMRSILQSVHNER